MQTTLARKGFDVGVLDGDLGPKTYSALLGAAVGRDLGALGKLLGRGMAANFPIYGLVTPLRIGEWISNGAHETMGFKRFTEMGNGDGPDADPWDDYLERYDFRKDLGNYAGGMGEKYRGRGIFNTTGLANYQRFMERTGIDVVSQPQRLAEPELAVLSACIFWADNKLNEIADRDDPAAVCRKINGGLNGFNRKPGGRLYYRDRVMPILLAP